MNRTALPQRIVAWVILGVAILCTIFPFYWMIRTAMTHRRIDAAVALAPHAHQLQAHPRPRLR